MKNTLAVCQTLTLVSALFFGTGEVLAQEGAVSLKLRDAIKMAVENNLDAKVELFNPALAQADLGKSLAIYDPLFTLNASYSRSTNPNPIFFTPLREDVLEFDLGASQLLTTGATAGATVKNGWTGNNVDYYSTSVDFYINQPLLKNFGKETTELAISVSRYNKEGAVDRFRTKLSDVVTQVRNDYFTLYSLKEDLEVKKTALALAQKILADTRGRVDAGVLPAMEILNAEFGVASGEKDVIDAERVLKDQMDRLRLSLQLDGSQDLVAVDIPTQEPYPVSEKETILHALAERPEIVAQRVNVTINDLQKRVAKNRTLPDLSLNANVGLGGFDPHFNRDLEKTANADYPMWGIGVQLTYPLGNHAAENDLIRAKLQLEQAQTQLKNLESSITNEVKSAIRAVSSSYKQIEVANRRTAYAEENLKAYQKRNAVGLATTKDVFDVLNQLVAAKGNRILAVVSYNTAITQLWRATGEILDRQGIKVSEREADRLYEKYR